MWKRSRSIWGLGGVGGVGGGVGVLELMIGCFVDGMVDGEGVMLRFSEVHVRERQ